MLAAALLTLLACGGATTEPSPPSDDAGAPATLDGAAGSDACPKAPAAYACETDDAGRVWWTLTEGCKTQRRACDTKWHPVCSTCGASPADASPE